MSLLWPTRTAILLAHSCTCLVNAVTGKVGMGEIWWWVRVLPLPGTLKPTGLLSRSAVLRLVDHVVPPALQGIQAKEHNRPD